MRTSRPILASHDRNTVSGATSVAPSIIARRLSRACIIASAAASWTRSLTPMTSASSASSVRACEPSRVGDLDEVGQVDIRSAHCPASPPRASRAPPRPAKATGPALQSRAAFSSALASLCSRIATSRPSRSIEPAVAGRVGRAKPSATSPAPSARPRRIAVSVAASNERNVGVGDQNVVVAAGDRLARRQNRVSGAAPLELNEDLRLRRGLQRFGGDVVPIRPDDDRDVVRFRFANRREHVGEHRPAGDLMQHLRPSRAHARALAGGEDDGEAAAGVGTHRLCSQLARASSAPGGPHCCPNRRLARYWQGCGAGSTRSRRSSETPFSRRGKMRLAAPQKSIYKSPSGAARGATKRSSLVTL